MAEAPYTGLTACLKVGSGSEAKVVAYISALTLVYHAILLKYSLLVSSTKKR